MVAYAIELLAYHALIGTQLATLLNFAVVSAEIAIPIAVIHYSFADISKCLSTALLRVEWLC